MRLNEIVDKEEYILFDNSISAPGNFIHDELYYCHSYGSLPLKKLRECTDFCKNFLNFVSYSNVHTIKNVLIQLNRLNEIISESLIYFNKPLKYTPKKAKQKHHVPEKVQELRLWQNNLYRCLQTINSSLYDPESEIYDIIADRIIQDEMEFHIKKNRPENDIHTDEKLIAAAFYLVISKKISPALITTDKKDFIPLFKHFYGEILGKEDIPLKIENKIFENPVRLFFPSDQRLEWNSEFESVSSHEILLKK